MLWDSDAAFEDRGIDGEGIVSFFHCPNCEADIELYLPETEGEG